MYIATLVLFKAAEKTLMAAIWAGYDSVALQASGYFFDFRHGPSESQARGRSWYSD